jgi:hypothetical protein
MTNEWERGIGKGYRSMAGGWLGLACPWTRRDGGWWGGVFKGIGEERKGRRGKNRGEKGKKGIERE